MRLRNFDCQTNFVNGEKRLKSQMARAGQGSCLKSINEE